jgi:hypothetical protein
MKIRKDKGKVKKDLTGLKFGLLTVIKFIGMKKQGINKAVSFYECKCECGTIKGIKGTHLTRGDTKTCGNTIHRIKPNKMAKSNAKFLSYQRHAKNRRLTWELGFPSFNSLIRMKCFYCNAPPIDFNGIDRLDNCVGYTAYNSVPCCAACNWMKRDYTLEQFLDKIEDIYTITSNSLRDY